MVHNRFSRYNDKMPRRGDDSMAFVDADLEILEEEMIDAFRNVLMLLPSQPSNPQYNDFLDQSRDYSYKPPFNAPKPPYPEMKLQVQLVDLT
jgi:hypothetical protein